MFSDIESTCGSLCGNERKKRSGSGRSGWTRSYTNTDTPSGTGDHEHYYYYYGDSNKNRFVYDSDGKQYTNCEKKAIQVREKSTGNPWWTLVNDYTLEGIAIFCH